MQRKKMLIIGYGEIGEAIYNIFREEYDVDVIVSKEVSRARLNIDNVEVMHICFPYSVEFFSEVEMYQNQYRPKYTVIHSTIPVGTSRKLNAIHSPVIGIHPYLTESIKTFTKFLGGERASEVADYFRRANIKVYITDKSETTELAKLMCTTKYGIDIEFVKEMKLLCDKYDIPFEFWTLWTSNYNAGYNKLGQEQFTRPNLVPIMKKTGGHCVLPNAELIETKFTKFLKELNK